MNLNESNIVGVSDLDAITTPALTDVLPAEQEGALGKLTLQQVANASHPIGSIFQQLPPVTIGETTYTPLSPNELFTGTTWVDISSGYEGAFFRANGENSSAFGTKQNEGLPNITGDFEPWGWYNTLNAHGAFAQEGTNRRSFLANGNSEGATATFDASKSNAIYGSSEHVTPENYSIKIWIRTA